MAFGKSLEIDRRSRLILLHFLKEKFATAAELSGCLATPDDCAFFFEEKSLKQFVSIHFFQNGL